MRYHQRRKALWSAIMGLMVIKMDVNDEVEVKLFTEEEAINEAERKKCIVAFY